MARLGISLLGPFGATLDGAPLTGLSSHRAQALLAYLAVEAHRPHPRGVLADLLWPERTEREALRNLSYALSDLRTALGDRTASPPFLRIDRDALQLDPQGDTWVDALEFLACVAPQQSLPLEALRRAVALYRGPYLEGFACDSAPFEEWLSVQRERYARLMLGALRRLGVQRQLDLPISDD